MTTSKVDLEQCPSCEARHARSLFKHHKTGRICIFCADKLDRQAQERIKVANKKLVAEEVARKTHTKEHAEELLAVKKRREQEREIAKERARKLREANAAGTADKQEMAAVELAQREICRRHLLPFVQRFNERYDAGWVHKDICARLEQFSLDIAAGKSPRLMLFMPPRHGKSELASRAFPAWHLGRYPEHEFISCSYSSDLAMDFSRKVREVIRLPAYKAIFTKTVLNKDSQRIDKWSTTADGGYTAAGVGGPITGRGAHCFVIDDPVKNREEADSESIRKSIKEWYTSTAYTRLAPGGGMLIILTRWHDDDLAGWLLNQAAKGQGDEWEVIEYPAEALEDERYRKKGEALHEARYPLSALKRIKRAIGERDWWALYQQRPVAEDGEFFSKEMFKMYGAAQIPAYNEMTYYTAWDFAIGQKEHNDETFGITVGVDRNRHLWVVDVRHGRWGAEQIVDQVLDMYTVWRSSMTGLERGHIEMAIGPYLEQEIRRRKLTSMYIEPLKTGRRDKQSRARPMQAMMQRGMIHFREGCDATQYLINQMLRFPSGVHDDGVDTMAWLGQMIGQMSTVRMPAAKKQKSWKDDLHRHLRTGGIGGGHMSA